MKTSLHPWFMTLNPFNCNAHLNSLPSGATADRIKSTTNKIQFKNWLAGALAALAIVFVTPTAPAVTYTWTGAGFFGNTNNLWSDLNNWQGLAAPSPGEANVTLIFPNTSAPRATTNDIVGLTVAAIQFQGANYIIAGKPATNALTLSSGALGGFSVMASANNCQFAASCPLVLGSSGGILVTSGNTLTIGARMSGTGGFTKYSAGTLRLAPTQANTFAGSLTVYDGTLDLQGGFFFLGSFFPVVTVPGGLVVGNSAAGVNPLGVASEANQIADASAVTIGENGELSFLNVDDTIGSLTLSGGSLDTGSGTLTLNGDVTAQLPSAGTNAGQLDGRLHLGNLSRTFNIASNASLAVSADIAGGSIGNAYAGIMKLGRGTLLLSGTNSYLGYTFINEGMVKAFTPQALGATNSPTTVATNCTLDLTNLPASSVINGEGLSLAGNAKLVVDTDLEWTGPITLSDNPSIEVKGTNSTLTLSGVVSGSGGFTKTGDGELWMVGPDNNTFTGTTLMRAGTLTLQKGTIGSPRISLPGQLKFFNQTNTGPKLVHSLRSESIGSGDLFMDGAGRLLLGPLVTQTLNALVLNGGEIDTGASGLLQVACNAIGTNSFSDKAVIKGRVDLGDSPRTFSLVSYSYIYLPASISGGPNATLNLFPGSGGVIRLQGSNSYSGLTVLGNGETIVEHPHALGATNVPTVVSNLAGLILFTSITNESLHLFGDGPNISYGALSGNSFETNTWRGPVILEDDAELMAHGPGPGKLIISGPISGPGGFTKLGEGELILAGVDGDNTYAGMTRLMHGTLTLAKSAGILNSVAIPNNLENGYQFDGTMFGGVLRVLGSGQFKTNCVINGYSLIGELRFEGGTNSVGTVKGNCDLWFGIGALLKTGFNNDNASFYGLVGGGDLAVPNKVCLEKHGYGTLAFLGTNKVHTLVAAMDVKQGSLSIAGSFTNTIFLARSGGTLVGQGDVKAVQLDGGTYWPGSIYHTTRAGVLSSTPGLAQGGTLKLGANHLEVNNAPNVDSMKLDLTIPINPVPPVGTQFMIVSNRSANPIIGTLNHLVTGSNLAEGEKFFDGNLRFSVSYVGGNGNDVVVTRVADPVPAQVNGIGPDPDGMWMNVSGEPGLVYRVEATFGLGGTNTWTQIGTATMNGSGFANFIDGEAKQYPQRFYRFVVP